jgi:hypothetical protein
VLFSPMFVDCLGWPCEGCCGLSPVRLGGEGFCHPSSFPSTPSSEATNENNQNIQISLFWVYLPCWPKLYPQGVGGCSSVNRISYMCLWGLANTLHIADKQHCDACLWGNFEDGRSSWLCGSWTLSLLTQKVKLQ